VVQILSIGIIQENKALMQKLGFLVRDGAFAEVVPSRSNWLKRLLAKVDEDNPPKILVWTAVFDSNKGADRSIRERANDLADQARSLIKLMGEEDTRVLRPGYVVELSSPEGSESYTIIKAPIDETKHPNVRFTEAEGGEKAWLIFNMNAWQYQVYEKLADKNIPGLLAGKLFKDGWLRRYCWGRYLYADFRLYLFGDYAFRCIC